MQDSLKGASGAPLLYRASQGYGLLAAGAPEGGLLTTASILLASGAHSRQASAEHCLPYQLDWRGRGLGQVSCSRARPMLNRWTQWRTPPGGKAGGGSDGW